MILTVMSGNARKVFEGIHGGYGIGERNTEGKMLLNFCDQKKWCASNT